MFRAGKLGHLPGVGHVLKAYASVEAGGRGLEKVLKQAAALEEASSQPPSREPQPFTALDKYLNLARLTLPRSLSKRRLVTYETWAFGFNTVTSALEREPPSLPGRLPSVILSSVDFFIKSYVNYNHQSIFFQTSRARFLNNILAGLVSSTSYSRSAVTDASAFLHTTGLQGSLSLSAASWVDGRRLIPSLRHKYFLSPNFS